MIKYPNGIKKLTKEKIYSNRGMTLENEINLSNEYYIQKDIAIIHKKPTPIQVVKQVNEKIENAYFKSPSTTDYNGVYKGRYIDFEAKETRSKTSFPLSNIHVHQIEHIKKIVNHNGICFLIIRFTSFDETYLLFAKNFIEYITKNDRKSIPLKFFKEKGFLIKNKINPLIDYIQIIEEEYYGK